MSAQSFPDAWGPDPYDDPLEVFGPQIGAHDVEGAVVAILKTWAWTYVSEISRRAGLAPGTYPQIRSYRVSSEMENMPEDQHPAVVVRSLSAEALRKGGGATSHLQTWRWAMEIGVQTVTRSLKAANGATPTPRLAAQIYCTALRGALVQKRDEGKVLGMIDVQGERYTELASTSDRSTHLAAVLATVEVPRVVEWGRGPAEPLGPPPDGEDPESPKWPAVQEVQPRIQKTPLDASLSEDRPGDQIPPRR